MTPLLFAAYNGHLPVAALLVERGADMEAKDNVSFAILRGGRGRVAGAELGLGGVPLPAASAAFVVVGGEIPVFVLLP